MSMNENKKNALQTHNGEQKKHIKATSKRLAKVAENRKIFVMRYHLAKAAGLLQK